MLKHKVTSFSKLLLQDYILSNFTEQTLRS